MKFYRSLFPTAENCAEITTTIDFIGPRATLRFFVALSSWQFYSITFPRGRDASIERKSTDMTFVVHPPRALQAIVHGDLATLQGQ